VLLVALGVSFRSISTPSPRSAQVDPKLFETAQVLGFSFWQRFRRSSSPAPPRSARRAAPVSAIAWLTLIVARQINADKGSAS